MTIIDDLFRELKLLGCLDDLKAAGTIPERWNVLMKWAERSNITKAEASFFSEHETLRLGYRFQQLGVDMGLCPYFRIFFSRRNGKYHHICKAIADKPRTFCKSRKEMCDKGIFDKDGRKNCQTPGVA